MELWALIRNSINKKLISEIIVDSIILAISCIVIIITLFCSPHQMIIPNELENVNVNYTYKSNETIPFYLCNLMSYLPALLLLIIFAILKKSPSFLIASIFCLLLCASSNLAMTNCAKLFAGRPRPHFYQRLLEKPEDVKSAYQSFPSGHSSSICNGMTFIMLLLAGQMKIFSSSQESWKILILTIPCIVALMVMITRTRDYYHNFSDIIGGGFIGCLTALLFYCNKFNSLFGERPDQMKVSDTKENERMAEDLFDV